jgi:tetratricopeptide (TPR) repeat protein
MGLFAFRYYRNCTEWPIHHGAMVRVLRVLRWVLFFEGWVLLATPATIHRWTFLLSKLLPESSQGYISDYLANFSVACWAGGCLCLATFWGMGRQKRWVRWTGLAVSLFNLAIFPPLGLTGLVVMRRFGRYNVPEESDLDVLSEETPLVRTSRTVLIIVLLAAGYFWLDSFADRLGIKGARFGWQTALLIMCGQVIVSLVHDLSHTLTALALRFSFPVVRLGPWVWARSRQRGLEIHIQANRLFSHDSYLSGIPGSSGHLRWDLSIVAAAGPVVSLLSSLSLFLAMLHTPDTPLANEGRFLGVLALLFGLDFSINMLPFGFSDARVLVDLIIYNRRGRNMVLQMRQAANDAMLESAQPALRRRVPQGLTVGPTADPVSAKRESLNLLLRRGVTGGLQFAQYHQDLGILEFLSGSRTSAKEYLERSLDLFAAFPDPRHTGGTWVWIEKLHRSRQAGVEAHYAYGRGVQAWESVKLKAKKMDAMVEAHVALATLHLGQGELGSCMEELEQAEPHLPRDSGNLLLAGRFHQIAAACGFRMRWHTKSRTHALAAARAYTHRKLDQLTRGMGLLHLGDLAWDLWLAGQAGLAVDFLAEAIAGLSTAQAERSVSHLRLMRAEILAKTGDRTAALEELENLKDPDADQERKVAEILGWGALNTGGYLDAIEAFSTAASTLDERERARLHVAEARALMGAGQSDQAVQLAREACDTLMKEEHGDAGVALLLLCAQVYHSDPGLPNHPFFDEGRRIIRCARFQPPPDKLLALRDLHNLFQAIGRDVEATEMKEEMQWVLQQMTWHLDHPTVPAEGESAAPEVESAAPEVEAADPIEQQST